MGLSKPEAGAGGTTKITFGKQHAASEAGAGQPTKVTFGKQHAPAGPSSLLMGRRGVPLSVPLPFLLTGVCMAAFFGLLAPWVMPEALVAPDFPHVLTLVHTITLGWVTMTIIGASLQLTPVIIVSPLRAVKLARWLYPLYIIGVLGLLSGFWWMRLWLLIAGGSLVVLAIALYVIVLGYTLTKATAHPVTVRFLVASLVYLCCVVSLGLTAALNFQFGFLGAGADNLLRAHITLGVIGWCSSVVIGVSYTLVRLFALVHEHDDRVAKVIFVVLNAGIVVLIGWTLVLWPALFALGGVLLAAAFWLFAYDYWRMFRVRHRKLLEVTQYHSIAAVVYGALAVPLTVVALLLGWQQQALIAALGLAVLVGWLGQSIVGYLYKIVPFLVWHTRYGPLVGYQKVPLMRDLIHERGAWLSWWLINVGIVGAVVSALCSWVVPLQIACGLLGCGLLLVAINIGRAVAHLGRREGVVAHSNPS